MIIQNETRGTVIWTCFNVNTKETVLPTGKLLASEVKNFSPPQKDTSKFFVRFTVEGTKQEVASGTCGPDQVIVLTEVDGSFSTKVVMKEVLAPTV